MSSNVLEMRAKIAEMGALMLKRNLTDLAGGNISVRVGDVVCMTPRYAGSRFQWNLRPEQVLTLDMEGNKLEGEGQTSRELKTHLKLLNKFPVGNTVIHAHARNAMVFCATQQPIPPVLECALKLGEIKVVQYGPGGINSEEFAENIAEGLRGQEDRIHNYAAAVVAPWHGLFAIGKDLDATVDAVERIEVNARCILLGKTLLMDKDRLDEHRAALAASVAEARAGGE